MTGTANKRAQGFTLIEVIVTLMIAAILGTLIFTYSQLTYTALPFSKATQAHALQRVMENIYTDHKLNYPSDLAGLKTKIGAEGTSPDNDYGQYQVVDNRYIKFVGNTETPIITGDPQDILKVTVKNNQGEKLSGLLTAK